MEIGYLYVPPDELQHLGKRMEGQCEDREGEPEQAEEEEGATELEVIPPTAAGVQGGSKADVDTEAWKKLC